MEIVYDVVIVFVIIVGFIFIVGALTKIFIGEYSTEDPTLIKHVKLKRVIPEDDTWEKRYLSLVQEIWVESDEELKEFSYDEDHHEVILEIRAMNRAVHIERIEENGGYRIS